MTFLLLTVVLSLVAQIDVAVNAPEAGTIKEFLVNEEDTVTVGQDIVKMELGGEKSSSSESKPAPEKKSEPESKPESKSESKPEPKKEAPKDDAPASKPAAPAKETSKPAPAPEKESATSAAPAFGSREERRVGLPPNLCAQSSP